MYNFNRNFFNKIDSEEKAYILGFIYADGYNSNTQVSIVQLQQDEDILQQINNALESDVEIKHYKQYNQKILCQLTFSSREMCKDLTRLGAIRNKSLVLTFPTFLDKSLLPHFIRGYFDGDGCVWNGKRQKKVVKDSKHKDGYRERIVHNVKFTFTGCFSFINALQDILIEVGVVKKKTKLNFSKAKDKSNNTSSNVCTMEYSGRTQMRNLFNYMYKNATIYGSRKFNKFQEVFCALEEKSSKDTSLIAGTPEMATSSQASIEEGSTTIPEMGVGSSESKCEAPNE